MAQPGNFTPILLYGSSTPTNVPLAANLTNSATGSEIAINVADKNLFFKDSGGTVNTVPIRQSSTSSDGWLSSTDWNTFNGKAPATSGTSILYGNGSGGFSNVTIGSGISFAGGTLSATGTGGTVTSVAALTLGTTGTDLSSTVANGTTTPVITLNVPTASATNRGALSAADWSTFNAKQPAGSYALTTGTLAQFAATTSAQLAGVISDETGSGSLVFSAAPTFTGVAAFAQIRSVYNGSAGSPAFDLRNSNGVQWEWYTPTSDNTLHLDVWVPGQRDSVLTISNSAGSHNVTIDTGNLVIGTSGKGIDFSATAGTGTSELLNDYEEGTFTPTIVGTTAAGTGTYNYQVGRYTKIGNRVCVNILLDWSAHTGTGNMRISGLPFTSVNVANTGSTCAVLASNITSPASTMIMGQINQNSTQVSLYSQAVATSALGLLAIDTAGAITVMTVYEV